MQSAFHLEAGVHHFDQIHQEALVALRSERKGFFVMVQPGPQPQIAFSISGTADEVEEFLIDVIATAQEELETVRGQRSARARH